MNKKIGLGIIGCGTISNVYLTNLTKNFHNVEVLAVADLFIEKARSQAEAFGIAKACTVEELLAMDEVQIVVNLTIPAAHYSVNMQALKAGKHVYCEKPLTLDLEQGLELVAYAREHELMVVSAPDTFLGSGGQSCRSFIDDGKIGTPIGFSASMTCAGHELWHPAPAFYYKAGGGPMLDMGPYYITMLVALLGPIRRISCFAQSGRPIRNVNGAPMRTEVPTHYTGIVEFVSGAIGNVTMSFDTWQTNLPCLEIYGTEGSITVPDPNMFTGKVEYFDGNKLVDIVENYNEQPPIPILPKLFALVTRSGDCRSELPLVYKAPEDPRTNMRGLGVSDMAQALIDGRKSRLDPNVSLHVAEALLAFGESAASGKVYEMTTTCERPAPMGKEWDVWEVK